MLSCLVVFMLFNGCKDFCGLWSCLLVFYLCFRVDVIWVREIFLIRGNVDMVSLVWC